MWLKRFSILLLVLLSLSSVLYSEVCLTDDEAEELSANLDQLETTLIQQEKQIEQQAIQLTAAQTLIELSEQQIQSASDSYLVAEKYWRRQRIEVAALAGSLGVALGFLLFLALGGVI